MTTIQITIVCLFASATVIVCTLIIAGVWQNVQMRRQGHTTETETYRDQLRRKERE